MGDIVLDLGEVDGGRYVLLHVDRAILEGGHRRWRGKAKPISDQGTRRDTNFLGCFFETRQFQLGVQPTAAGYYSHFLTPRSG
jgi:hypothetical protein